MRKSLDFILTICALVFLVLSLLDLVGLHDLGFGPL